ncbi:MAG TPA: PEGA domain-containing protein [Tepidisphaeraceae bacterium]|jgi:hypothetical protein|nr:PEGA domain-containing protein [Tepidisphaeraceae bacterium]
MVALRCGVVLSMLVLAIGCGPTTLQVRSTPPGATVMVDGNAVGTTPTPAKFDFGKKSFYEVSANKVGYIGASQTVASGSAIAKRGYVNFDLIPDQAYTQTTVSDAANNWRRIQVDKQFDKAAAWQRMIDSVTTRYSNLEQMDQASGYLRSVGLTRTFRTPGRGEFSVRTYFIGTIAQAEPLVYKVKIVSERSEVPGMWEPYDRVFTGDQELIDELQNRLGTK